MHVNRLVLIGIKENNQAEVFIKLGHISKLSRRGYLYLPTTGSTATLSCPAALTLTTPKM